MKARSEEDRRRILTQVEARHTQGMLLYRACADAEISVSTYYRWKRKRRSDDGDPFVRLEIAITIS